MEPTAVQHRAPTSCARAGTRRVARAGGGEHRVEAYAGLQVGAMGGAALQLQLQDDDGRGLARLGNQNHDDDIKKKCLGYP